MFQPDLFTVSVPQEPVTPAPARSLDLPAVLERLSTLCQRPRYSSEGVDFSSAPTGEHDYCVTWTSRADPPAEIRLVPMENIAEERPGEAVVWRVQAAE